MAFAMGMSVSPRAVNSSVHLRRKESAAPALVLAVLGIASAVLGFLVVL